ncbi:hypothetical protein [Kocuria sp. U4B]
MTPLLLTGWEITGIVASVAAAVLAVPVLTLAIRQELRATHRGEVEWQDEKVSHGTFLIRNTGLDVARDVTIRAWTRHEPEVIDTAEVVASGDAIKIHLPRRDRVGPDFSEVPPQIEVPCVSDEMPSMGSAYNGIMGRTNMEAEMQDRWRRQKAMQDAMDSQRQNFVESVIGQQVAVSIVWRTKYGQWHKHELSTG